MRSVISVRIIVLGLLLSSAKKYTKLGEMEIADGEERVGGKMCEE